MSDTVKVYCKNLDRSVEVPVQTSLSELDNILDVKLPNMCVGARVNNKAQGLDYKVYNPKDVEFLDVSSLSGMRIYVRSLCFVLFKAIDEVIPGSRLRIEHPISRGYFCNINNREIISDETLDRIRERMREIVEDDLPFIRKSVHRSEAIRIFRERDMTDKVELLESTGMLYTDIYKLDEHYDFYYGSLLPSTGMLRVFDLQRYNDGLLLIVPQRKHPSKLETVTPQPKMMNVLNEFTKFNFIAHLSNVGNMNKVISKGKFMPLIQVSEALQEKKIINIADEIARRQNVKVVLISGPSSSGKTTFSKRLSIQLMTNFINPISISLDDYFVEREHSPRDENGDYDFESLYALDLELFNDHINKLINGEMVEIPTYNFGKGKKEYKGNKLKLRPGSVLILEGIHALNPALTTMIDEKYKFKIYVSALTSISLDDHNWIPTTDNRLIRRIVRDNQFRKCPAEATIARWESVRAGEDKWIFPYQENADMMFNSAMLYELSVLKKQAEPLLQSVPAFSPYYAEAFRLLRFLSYFKAIEESEIPPLSLLREFLGGSSFNY